MTFDRNFNVEMSSDIILQCLGWETLHDRRENHILKLVNRRLARKVPEHFKDIFIMRHENIYVYATRRASLLHPKRVELEQTKFAFF